MSYDPEDHAPTARQVAAAWGVCLGIVLLALGMTAKHPDLSTAADAAPELIAGAPDRCPMSRVRIPRFAQCAGAQADASLGFVPANRAAIALPIEHCG